jgi:hypothetical protein
MEDDSERCGNDDGHHQQQHNVVMRRVISESEISIKSSDSSSASREYRVRKSSLIGYVIHASCFAAE